MPNKRWNNIHSGDKTSPDGDGKGKTQTTSNTYGNSPTFKTMTDADNTLDNPNKPK